MTDKKTPGFINAKRRGFLQGATVAGGVVASGVAASAELAQSVETTPTEPVSQHKGYERTEHVKKYYQRARF